MSINVSIEINFIESSPIDIILILLNFGWIFDDNGYQTYLPVGDNDKWDWNSEKLDNKQLLSILKEKVELSEVIGVGITWSNTGRGGELIFLNVNSLIFNLSNNRLVNGYLVTDFDWYLNRMIEAFNVSNILIESIKCEELR